MFLRDSGLLHPSTSAEVSLRIPAAAPKETAYSDEEFRRVRTAARRVFRRARKRIMENAEHLRRHRRGEFREDSNDYLLGEALETIAATGDAPRNWQHRDRPVAAEYAAVLGGNKRINTWMRLYLDASEITAALILIACKEGWNATSIDELEVPTRVDGTPLAGDHSLMRVELEKRRRHQRNRFEVRTLRDTGAGSTARLLTHILEMTRPARELLAAHGADTSRLLISRKTPVTPDVHAVFSVGVTNEQKRIFVHSTGVSFNLRRIRKTVNTRHLRQPNQNTQDTHDSQYVVRDPEVIRRSEDTIARGLERAVTHASEVLATISDFDHESGDETPTAECTDILQSPFSPWGAPCTASFLLCLSCVNAVVMPKHLGRLALLHEALANVHGAMREEAWDRQWAVHFRRLESLRHDHYTDAQWAQALRSVTDVDRRTVGHLLEGSLGA
ncbi:hypothetical protein [Zhihengliuella sp. ISTPL4]|uniref:hypothetical protein n=1 Tax=Zhihengliuella sp. ISTPL4 TaxID=2058657 RepID=UPI0018F1647F|nr:hypothetical protein [Zhihengliuella sp. ISTPL4]